MRRRERAPFYRHARGRDHVPEGEVHVPEEEVYQTRADAIDRAERTLDVQRERFDRVDEKASKMLRFVAVLSGAVFAVLGLGPRVAGVGRARIVDGASVTTRIALGAAAVGFVGTVLFAAATYVTTRFGSSFGAGAAEDVREDRFGRRPYQKLVLDAYSGAIRRNRPRLDRNRRQFVVALCSLVVAVSFLTVAAGILIADLSPTGRRAVLAVTVVLTLGFVFWVLSETSTRGE